MDRIFSPLIAELKKHLPESSWSWVIPALQEDSIVWFALSNLHDTFNTNDLGELIHQPEDCTPATLALRALQYPSNASLLRSLPLQPVEDHLLKSNETISKVDTLRKAGIRAISLRQLRIETGSWDDWCNELWSASPTTLCCLYGMIPDQMDMLHAMMPTSNGTQPAQVHAALENILHILLSNPSRKEAQIETINILLESLPSINRIFLIELIYKKRPGLASKFSNYVPGIHIPAETSEPRSIQDILNWIDQLYLVGKVQHITDQPKQEVNTLARSLKISRQLQSRLSNHLALASLGAHDNNSALAAWDQSLKFEKESKTTLPLYLFSLIEAGEIHQAREKINQIYTNDPTELPPLVFFIKVISEKIDTQGITIGTNGKSSLQSITRQALDYLENEFHHATKPADVYELVSQAALANEMVHWLLDHRLWYEAARAAKLLAIVIPHSTIASFLVSTTLSLAGFYKEALATIHYSIAINPENIVLRRLLAQLLEITQQYPEALQEAKALIEKQQDPKPDDLYAMAAYGIATNQPDLTIKTCQELLKNDPNDGLGYALLGKAAEIFGDHDEAIQYLQKATQLTPQHCFAWLALASYYEKNNQKDEQLTTLQAAAQTIPNRPEIHLALGIYHQSQGAFTQALSEMRRAVETVYTYSEITGLVKSADIVRNFSEETFSIPKDYSLRYNQDFLSHYLTSNQLLNHITALLGETLHKLGHLNEALQLLENSYRDFPYDPEIAYGYAEVLTRLNEHSKAIKPYEVMIDSMPDKADPYLGYARCLLHLAKEKSEQNQLWDSKNESIINQSNDFLEKAAHMLNLALENDPCKTEARVLLAETLSQKGEYEKALRLFDEAMASDLSHNEIWKDRLALDLSHVALKLNRGDLALTALLEADRNNSEVLRRLSETYISLELMDDAFNTACEALHKTPDDINTLIWFANIAQNLKDHQDHISPKAIQKAISALSQALEMAPHRGDLWVLLGKFQHINKDLTSARRSFKMLTPESGSSLASDSSSADLYTAGKFLLELDEPRAAISCLETALQNQPPSIDRKSQAQLSRLPLQDVLNYLATAYRMAGEPQKALVAYDQALSIDPSITAIHLEKSELLASLTKPGEAPRAAAIQLENALKENPNNEQSLFYSALLQRASGNLEAAQKYIDQLLIQHAFPVSESPDEEKTHIEGTLKDLTPESGLVLAYDIAKASLQPVQARKYLSQSPSQDLEMLFEDDPQDCLPYPSIQDYVYCLLNNHLESDKDNNDSSLIDHIISSSLDDPRALAAQARINFLQGDLQASVSLLNNALEKADQTIPVAKKSQNVYPALDQIRNIFWRVNVYRTIASIAGSIYQWQTVLTCVKKIIELAPLEPLSFLDLGICLVRRAEYQQLCQELEITYHAPGIHTLDKQTYQKFLDSINSAQELLNPVERARDSSGQAAIEQWTLRGKAIFHSNDELSQDFLTKSLNPEYASAQIIYLRRISNLEAANRIAQAQPPHPLVLLQYALNHESEQPRQALVAIQAAYEMAEKNSIRVKYIIPAIQFLYARLVNQTGSRTGDYQNAIEAIENALAIWPEETNWHSLAADIYLKLEPADFTQAIKHLEQAVQQDPDAINLLLILGIAYLNHQKIPQAIQVLEFFTRQEASNNEGWRMLGCAYLKNQQLKEAKTCLNKALRLAPQNVQTLKLQAEVALLGNDFTNAFNYAQTVLGLDAENLDAMVIQTRALIGQAKFTEAQQFLDQSLAQFKGKIPLFLERARLVKKVDGLEATIRFLQENLVNYPDHPSPFAYLAELLEEAGKNQEAIVTAQQALRLGHHINPEFSFDEHAGLHTQLGRLMRQSGQLDQAVQHLCEAIQLSPDWVEPYLELGQSHMERRQHQDALDVFQQAIEAVPESSLAFFRAGLAFKECKDYLKAETMLRQAARMEPENLSIQRQLGAVVALNLVHNRKQ